MKSYPMPCPACRKMIDARNRTCPHCGVDTDAKLAPLAVAFVLAGGGLVLGLLWVAGIAGWLLGIGAGMVAGIAIALIRATRPRS